MCHFSLWCTLSKKNNNLTLKSFPFLPVTNQPLINLPGRKMKRRRPKIWINIQEQLRCQRTLGLIVSLTTVSKQPLVIKAFRHPRHSSTLLCLSLSWFALLSRVLPFLQSRQFLCWCDRLQPLTAEPGIPHFNCIFIFTERFRLHFSHMMNQRTADFTYSIQLCVEL